MLLKTDHDAIDKVRNDPRVREAIYLYGQMLRATRASLTIFVPETGAAHPEAEWSERERTITVTAAMAGMAFDVPIERHDFKYCLKFLLASAIKAIAKAYKAETGKSPLTTDPVTGEHLFSTFVRKLFKQEALKVPSIYAIKQAIKKDTRPT